MRVTLTLTAVTPSVTVCPPVVNWTVGSGVGVGVAAGVGVGVAAGVLQAPPHRSLDPTGQGDGDGVGQRPTMLIGCASVPSHTTMLPEFDGSSPTR